MMGPQLATFRRSRRRRSGQAAVESALVLPLLLFMILGTLQLSMMYQARVMAEYAAYRAARAGSVNHGSCQAMNHAALAAVLPTLRDTSDAEKLGAAFAAVQDNTFGDGYTTTNNNIQNEQVVWIFREAPLPGDFTGIEDGDFDYIGNNSDPMQLEISLVYWFPLRIPFADWVIFRTAMAAWGVQAYTGANPLMLTDRANWSATGGPGDALTQHGEVLGRLTGLAGESKYLFPIRVGHTMRMMTPAKRHHMQPNCFES